MKLDHLPYPSRRQPVFATNGAVATSQPLAAQAGLDVLRAGGNAVDAALATAIALTVVEPTSNGIGGDLFAIVWDGSKLHGLNSSGRAPRALDAGRIRGLGFGATPELGWVPVTVPGVVAGWEVLHERFGRADRERVYRAAVAYARDGFAVSPVVADSWAKFLDKLDGPSRDPALGPQLAGWRAAFARDGRAPAAGDRWCLPDHARTLETLAREGADALYTGALGAAIVEFASATGGYLTAGDLAAHRPEWVEPIGVPYGGCEVWEIPPNGQGIAALMGLSILDGFDLTRHPHVGVENWHLEMEAMKLAFADTHRHVGDPEFSDVPVAAMLSPEYAAARRALVGERALAREPGELPAGGTVYLCTADRDGMMVSLIQSNYHGFGSGIVVPGTGIALHNRGLGFNLEEGHPNEYAPGQASLPHHHSRLPHPGREGRRPVRSDGGADAATGSHPGRGGDPGPWAQPPGGPRCAPLAGPRRPRRGHRARSGDRPPSGACRTAVTGWRWPDPGETYQFGRGQIIWSLDDGVYAAGSDPRADGLVAAW